METVRFDELELQPQILRGIKAMGFEEATPIQSQAIPVVMSGSDVIGQAQTGTGKTAAFGIPILQTVDPSNKKTQVIILSPTRELAIQVADEIRALAKYMHGVKVLPVYGGQEISKQIRSLKGGAPKQGTLVFAQYVVKCDAPPAGVERIVPPLHLCQAAGGRLTQAGGGMGWQYTTP